MPPSEPFTTIDDALQLAEELTARLKRLGGYKHPLAVRKGVMTVRAERESQQIRAGSRTYFIDVEQTKEGKPFLRLTESRFKGEGEERERSSIILFPESAEEFAAAVTEMVAKLGEA